MKRKLSSAEEKANKCLEEHEGLIDNKERSMTLPEAGANECQECTLKGDDDAKEAGKYLKKIGELERKNEELCKTLNNLVGEKADLINERDKLVREVASKDLELVNKKSQIDIKRETIDAQNDELADLRLKSKKIGALLR